LELTSPWTAEQSWRTARAKGSREYHSLALPGLVARLDGERKFRVLDLGPAHGLTVEFFSRFSCKLYIADLYRTLQSYRIEPVDDEEEDEEDDRLSKIFSELLPYDPYTRFDLVLAWDLLNYLEPREIEALSRRLGRFSHAATRLFAMIAIHQEIPARPCGFKIRDSETLEYDTVTSETRSAPRHKEPTLRRLMPGFEVGSTCVLRNGLQEYVFIFSGLTTPRRAG